MEANLSLKYFNLSTFNAPIGLEKSRNVFGFSKFNFLDL
jgi:hypothetical protein